ncbi:hypothetical protein FRB96_008370 [Tulasnella sp. 330]|nr:hypothetical protein FRB96_008370 [Tulasnella sp. 330]KAG8889852.1 hypothetical protein FRB98_002205 [Tulasnella sp. 332]
MTSARGNRVAIIGGGPAGLGCLRVFAESQESWKLTLLEEREQIGGIWYRGDDKALEAGGRPPPSAIYDSLTTNIPHPIMSFNDFPFRGGSALYPIAADVQQYLLDYAEHFALRKYIQLDRRVDRAEWNGSEWRICFSRLGEDSDRTSSHSQEMACDFLIVANGHYNRPYFPDIPGLKEWATAGREVSHAKWYREPSGYAGKTVLVIGGGPSGHDISTELVTVAKATYHSVRGFARGDSVNPRRRDGPVEFKEDGMIVYADGTHDIGIDHVILGTGYEFSFPMLSQVIKAPSPLGVLFPGHLHHTSWNVYPLARHIFPIQDDFPPTSLGFLGLPSRVAPFPLIEIQALAALHVFAHPEALEIEVEKQQIIERRKMLEEKTDGNEREIARLWHRIPNLEQFDYRRDLLRFAGTTKWDIKPWHEEAYMNKGIIRDEWKYVLYFYVAS